MNPIKIERWALNIIDRVKSKNPIEDFRVELKSEWINPQKAARLIAGHANAARGESILWLIGVDEKKGVIGAKHEEIADWFIAVKAEFDGIYPSMTDLNIPIDNSTIVALYFETDRAPYVIRNPAYNIEKGNISYETPWREGTSIRSARRSDLIKILIPVISLPEIEILSGMLTLTEGKDLHWYWDLKFDTYVTPPYGYYSVLPFHQCEASFTIINRLEKTYLTSIKFKPPYKYKIPFSVGSGASEPDSFTIKQTDYEVIIDGPGRLTISAEIQTELRNIRFDNSKAEIIIKIRPSHSNTSIQLNETMYWKNPDENRYGQWVK
jgi:hypothetical protein